MSEKVFLFDTVEPNKAILGGKGASLAQMTKLGMPVPPGFTITTGACIDYLKNKNTYPDGMWKQVEQALSQIEKKIGKLFGDKENPLLVSVRSGAKISMPGMMDTILNLGLTQEIVENLSKDKNKARYVKDSYRRLILMFANVVSNLKIEPFEELLESIKEKSGVTSDHELTESDLDQLISGYLQLFEKGNGKAFPQDPKTQLDQAIQAVFKSWNNKRAIAYRLHEGIPHDIGTAVNVQSMVFGNFNEKSGTGVLFSRNPSNGVNEIYGEFLLNAQGEDVVAGLRTPQPISMLNDKMPKAYGELIDIAKKLEVYYKDMQDIEFTIENEKLFMLQTRTGKRTGAASARIAFEMVNEGLITKKEAVLRVTPRDVEASLFPSVLWKHKNKLEYYKVPDLEHQLASKTIQEITRNAEFDTTRIIGEGLPAGPGAACGHIVFSSDLAESIVKDGTPPPFAVKYWRKQGEKKVPSLILVKKETSPEDFHGMVASSGIVTMTGGLTSHAALVGRQIGKRVIVGASTSMLDLRGSVLRTGSGDILKVGDVITIEIFDRGLIFGEALPIMSATKLSDELETILDWADSFAKIKVRANADKEGDTQVALDFKAVGTGLARTEHMFFDSLELMQEMILAEDKADRLAALDKMAKIQKEDFVKLFRVVKGLPVTIRLLDPPLHEFLPKELEVRERIWTQILNPVSTEHNTHILRKVLYYQEANPMLGLRGCRLGLLFPEITVMQTRAIIEAAIQVKNEGISVLPEIMVPLAGFAKEFTETRKIIDATAKEIFEKSGDSVHYLVGTMIEIPRAALTADEIAEGELGADFFSFGTNDLHQMTLGFSRDDVGKFLPFYLENKIIEADPFQTIDEGGVGKLIDLTVKLGREAGEKVGKYIKISCCGEQAGDPESIDLLYRMGLDIVSCSPYRVPVARLAAAQATMKNGEVDSKYRKKL